MSTTLAQLVPLKRAITAVNESVGHWATDSQKLIAAKCRGMLCGYHARWAGAEYRPLEIEKTLTADLTNPDTGRPSRTFSIAGKLDLLADYRGKLALFDHKTTSQDIADPNAPFWRQLVVEAQVNHYWLLLWMHGRKADFAVWDVVRKPTISPRKLTDKERRATAMTREYFQRPLSDWSVNSLRDNPYETVEMYEARLAHDCTKERPDRYFQRRVIPRMDPEILEYARELWEHGQEILHARNTDRHARNSGACMLYGSPCRYLGICSGHDTPDSDKWQRAEQVHKELPLAGDGRDVLTNSSIRCFQTCRRKFQYQYEMGLERQDEEEREALYFGTVWHLGLNAWWSTFLNPNGEQHGNASGDSANEVERSGVRP